ncbi:MAG: flagellar biosynthetic protein FliO [Alphaproteobacteria bacterium]|nr:flagellar biosynthetic protein FliO [Alphaproteobacteria bacterium]
MEAALDWIAWARALFALVATLALIGLAAYAARRFGMLSGAAARGERRLKIVETLMIDPRRRLVIVRMDDREHLLLLSASGDRRVASGDAKGEAAP